MRRAQLPVIAFALALSACNTLALNSSTATSALSSIASPNPAGTAVSQPQLSSVKFFAIVLQNVGQNGSTPVDVANIASIAQSRYDVVTIDEVTTSSLATKLPALPIVNSLHATAGADVSHKIVLAYIDLGEAENYRTYWQQSWTIGSPSFILGTDPNGFPNNFTVNYSDPGWKSVVFGSSGALIDQAIADGFDGVFLDNVGAYNYPAVSNADRNAQSDMVTFVAAISIYAKSKSPNFFIVTNNGAGLTNDSRFVAAIDADSEESLFYGSSPTQQGDIPADKGTQIATLTLLQRIQAVNKPVFSIDYATSSNNAQLAYAGGAANRLIEYVTTRALSQLTATPPSSLSPSSAHRSVR